MIKRVLSCETLSALLEKNARDDWLPGVGETEAWLTNPANFALVDGDDLGLFEAKDGWPGPLHAHVMFASRGRDALRIAKAMLAQAFEYGATEIRGETPARFKDAWLFARMLGFRKIGEEDRPQGKVILSRLNNNPSRTETVA